MAITLKFFMIKRGLTVEKMAAKSNARSAEELIAYARTLNIGVTAADEALVKDYFATITTEVLAADSATDTEQEEVKPVLEKKKRGKKSVGKNV